MKFWKPEIRPIDLGPEKIPDFWKKRHFFVFLDPPNMVNLRPGVQKKGGSEVYTPNFRSGCVPQKSLFFAKHKILYLLWKKCTRIHPASTTFYRGGRFWARFYLHYYGKSGFFWPSGTEGQNSKNGHFCSERAKKKKPLVLGLWKFGGSERPVFGTPASGWEGILKNALHVLVHKFFFEFICSWNEFHACLCFYVFKNMFMFSCVRVFLCLCFRLGVIFVFSCV
mgnify:FL=1